MLWLCIDLPFLPLEVCTRAAATRLAPEPGVVSEGQGRAQQVLLANEAAMRRGIRRGMPLNAAHALVSKLRVVERDAAAEHAALERLAAWVGQFTPAVSIVEQSRVPPRALLLEIQGSLGLFGGLKPLRQRLRAGMAELGYSALLSVAPTPLAATWFARAADEEPVTDLCALAGRLFELDLACLDLSDRQRELLCGMGLSVLGDCVRLPREGLTRRFGAEFVLALDRAFGRLPDPRKFFVAPAMFAARLALPGTVDHVEGVLFPLQRLLHELTGFLTARVAGVQALELVLRHPPTGAGRRSAPTRIALTLTRTTRDRRHLSELLREQLARVELPAPVEEIALSAAQLLPLAASEADFFAPRHAHPGAAAELIERLAARLGRDAVRGVRAVADHRPEQAWRYVDAHAAAETGAAAAPMMLTERPLWLLPKPLPLNAQDDRLRLDGTLAPERERIETGWWNGNDVRRDYRIACDAEGVRWWVYRELGGEKAWWLQGVFG